MLLHCCLQSGLALSSCGDEDSKPVRKGTKKNEKSKKNEKVKRTKKNGKKRKSKKNKKERKSKQKKQKNEKERKSKKNEKACGDEDGTPVLIDFINS